MPFSNELSIVYEKAIKRSLLKNNCEPIRGDTQSSFEIDKAILDGIKNADVCIADLTGLNSNVIYEVGISIASLINTILITQDKLELIPFNLNHFRIIRYHPDQLDKLQKELTDIIAKIFKAEAMPIQLLKEMLIPDNIDINNDGSPFIIASNPLSWRAARQRGGGFKALKATYGDHTGIRGIVQAFGSIKGLNTLPELINTGDFVENVALKKANIYCIASPKANHWTNILMKEFCSDKKPVFSFHADIYSDNLRDVHINLHMDGSRYIPPGWDEKEHRYKRDFGLIVRGPHPKYPGCMIMILAGRGSIGTEAACRAVTEPKFIKEIKDRLELEKIELNDYENSFWSIASLNTLAEGSREIDLNSFKVIDAGGFV